MEKLLGQTISQIYEKHDLPSETRRLIIDKMYFVAQHINNIINRDNGFHVTDITAIPELSTSDVLVKGIDDYNLAYSPGRIKVFIGGVDTEGEDLDEFQCIMYNKKLFYFLVLGVF